MTEAAETVALEAMVDPAVVQQIRDFTPRLGHEAHRARARDRTQHGEAVPPRLRGPLASARIKNRNQIGAAAQGAGLMSGASDAAWSAATRRSQATLRSPEVAWEPIDTSRATLPGESSCVFWRPQ